jgi:PAS domain S-box-containing protein
MHSVMKSAPELASTETIDYRAIVDGAGLGIAMIDATTLRFRTANAALCGLLGYSEDELVGGAMTTIDVTHPDDRKFGAAKFRELISEDLPNYTLEKRYVRKDGKVILARIVVTYLSERRSVVGIIKDISHGLDPRAEPSSQAVSNPVLLAAENYIDVHWNTPFTVDDIARAIGVKPGTVFRLFGQYRGCTPNQYLKHIRLDRSRTMLMAPDKNTTVTAVSLFCGFQNLGHFARDYRKRFFELPSQTLLKARQPAH